jgi:hypothetical protein
MWAAEDAYFTEKDEMQILKPARVWIILTALVVI